MKIDVKMYSNYSIIIKENYIENNSEMIRQNSKKKQQNLLSINEIE